MKKIFILNSHPEEGGLISKMVTTYKSSAEIKGVEVRVMRVFDMKFDVVLHHGYRQIQDLESDLKEFQNNISWCDHLVIAYPTWWGGMPAVLKGLIDRAFLPPWAFKFEPKPSRKWSKNLKGKSARIITTMDTPEFVYRFLWGNPAIKQLKHTILEFCGFAPVKFNVFGSVKFQDEKKINKWIAQIEKIAQNDCD